ALACRAGNWFFVGPDNGVLSYALSAHADRRIYRLENDAFFHAPVSRTFHGRDIFAPVSAHLSSGAALDEMGPVAEEYAVIEQPDAVSDAATVRGTVTYIDRFGNAFTNITAGHVERLGGAPVAAAGPAGGIPLCACYADVARGDPLAIVNSTGCLEIAVNGGSAARKLGLAAGDPVSLTLKRA
ncbi:MAG: hypothetical protein GF418_10150, partial [Chitinivibrionales bacterium]|nr:hypothetical protein [Chitinivibrionales bacterium]MBD3395974.1 hypothetical protein [Chitinivibrionales bacterium]